MLRGLKRYARGSAARPLEDIRPECAPASRAECPPRTSGSDTLISSRRSKFRNRYLLLLDAILVSLTPLAAYGLRFEGFDWTTEQSFAAAMYLAASVPIKLAIYLWLGLYRRLWRHASVAELERILIAMVFSGAACSVFGAVLLPWLQITVSRVPLSVLFMDALLTGAVTALPRFFARLLEWRRQSSRSHEGRRALIVGAGDAGQMIVRELLAHPNLGLAPIGFVDDDASKLHHRLGNLPVLGTLRAIPEILRSHDVAEVIIAMPSAPGNVVRQVVRAALECGARTRTMPGLFEILSGKVGVSQLRSVEIQDLLRRSPVETDLDAVRSLATERTVLVTGAGGSIGSELCRQLARIEPARLVVLGHGENSIFEILNELRLQFPAIPTIPVIADVRDRNRIFGIFATYRPHAVFHAAAHKHVPLMEENVAEAISNNIVGTRNVVDAAVDAGTEHFVLISTDKVVRPTSVMGATKRVAEYIVQRAAHLTDRNFVAVRFGNVLGSRGSVVPTFLNQIRAGGPVLVTHPDMRRFFMTIPEAVQLVLQAGALGRGGEVFVLDMGEAVRIVDLAKDLIRLSGLEVGKDIDIRYTGMRPGEKLYEEVFFSSEVATPTEHPKVLRARNGHLRSDIDQQIELLVAAARAGREDRALRDVLSGMVDDFQASEVQELEPPLENSAEVPALAEPSRARI
jgi:FlaA1/EpsC-like NDP-sugar epimerase